MCLLHFPEYFLLIRLSNRKDRENEKINKFFSIKFIRIYIYIYNQTDDGGHPARRVYRVRVYRKHRDTVFGFGYRYTNRCVQNFIADVYAAGSTDWQYLFGYSKDAGGSPLGVWVSSDKIKETFVSGNGNVIADANKWEHIDITNSNTVTISDFYIFHVNPINVTSYTINPGRIKYLQLKKDGDTIRDMVSAKRNSDSVIGMYDTVNNRFYTNAGTGSFVAGPIACDGTVVNYTSATGTVTQNGTPTPTNPITPTFYTQGDMVLRKVGDYADTYDATTGKITRKVGVKVLDGSEDWGVFSTGAYATNPYFSTSVTNLLVGGNQGTKLFCNMLTSGNIASSTIYKVQYTGGGFFVQPFLFNHQMIC